MQFLLQANRESRYFFWSAIFPLIFIVLMAWSVFWINPTHISTQIGVSTAAIFSLLAFRFSLMQMLPEVDYMTRLDKFLIASTALVFLALGESVLTSRYVDGGRPEIARRYDRIGRWIYLSIFLLVLISTLYA